MKLKFLFIALMSFVSFAFSQSKEGFPKYSESMNTARGCHADCFLVSCSGTADCHCECSIFKCKCTPKTISDNDGSGTLSMNRTQYDNTKNLATFIRNFKTAKTEEIYQNFSKIVSAIKNSDNEMLSIEREKLLNNLEGLNANLKGKINSYLAKKGSKLSI